MLLREVMPEFVRLEEEYNSEECTDERRLQIESELSELDLTIADKSDSISELIAYRTAKAATLKAEEDRLALWRKREERSAEWLKRYLTQCLLGMKLTKFETDFHKFSFRKSEALKVENEELIPENFFIPVPATKKLDNALLKKAIQNGEIVEGATVEIKQNLQIK